MAARSSFSKGWKGFVDHKWIKNSLFGSASFLLHQLAIVNFILHVEWLLDRSILPQLSRAPLGRCDRCSRVRSEVALETLNRKLREFLFWDSLRESRRHFCNCLALRVRQARRRLDVLTQT